MQSSTTAAPATILSPKQIGQYAAQVNNKKDDAAADSIDQHQRLQALGDLLEHIRNIPANARPDLRIKNNILVAKLATGEYQELIAGFRLKKCREGNIDALNVLIATEKPTHGSWKEKLHCKLSSVWNQLKGSGAHNARSEHLDISRDALRDALRNRQHQLVREQIDQSMLMDPSELEKIPARFHLQLLSVCADTDDMDLRNRALGLRQAIYSLKSEPTPALLHAHLFNPEEIGKRANEAYVYSKHQDIYAKERSKQLETLAALRRHIRSIPKDMPHELRIRNNNLVARLGTGEYRTLIAGFQRPIASYLCSRERNAATAFEALKLKLPECLHFDSPGRSQAPNRDEGSETHLPFDLGRLEEAVIARQNQLIDFKYVNPDPDDRGPFVLPAGLIAADLKGLGIKGKQLHLCDFRQADLRGSDLQYCMLPIDMTGADLSGTKITYVAFKRPGESAGWDHRKIYPDFSGVKLSGAKLTMTSPFEFFKLEKNHIMDIGFNHLNNVSSGSILKSIHSIEDSTLKKDLMETCMADLVAHTSREDRASISRPLIDILFNHDYLANTSEDSSIRKVVDEIIDDNFAHGDKNLLDLSTFFRIDLRLFLDEHLRHALSLTEKSALEAAPAAFCQQLLQACTNSEEDQELHERAISLQRKIFELPFHAGAIQGMCDILGYDNGNEVELGGLVTFGADDQESIIMTGQYYRNFVQNIAIENDLLENPDEGIELFAASGENIRSKPIDYIAKNEFLNKFLKPSFATTNITYMLGFKLNPAYEKLFNEGRLSSVLGNKDMVSPEDKIYLASVVDPFLEDQQISTRRLVAAKKSYIERLMANHSMDNSSVLEQGYLLLCMSALFTKYSSSSHFGTEYDSPDALRALAAGLLTSARELLPNAARGEEITQLQDILLGNGGAFTCTSVAYIRMKRLLLEICTAHPALRPIYEKILPPTWR
jgi:hypothetical protein